MAKTVLNVNERGVWLELEPLEPNSAKRSRVEPFEPIWSRIEPWTQLNRSERHGSQNISDGCLYLLPINEMRNPNPRPSLSNVGNTLGQTPTAAWGRGSALPLPLLPGGRQPVAGGAPPLPLRPLSSRHRTPQAAPGVGGSSPPLLLPFSIRQHASINGGSAPHSSLPRRGQQNRGEGSASPPPPSPTVSSTRGVRPPPSFFSYEQHRKGGCATPLLLRHLLMHPATRRGDSVPLLLSVAGSSERGEAPLSPPSRPPWLSTVARGERLRPPLLLGFPGDQQQRGGGSPPSPPSSAPLAHMTARGNPPASLIPGGYLQNT